MRTPMMILLVLGLLASGCRLPASAEIHDVATVSARPPVMKMVVLVSSMMPEDRRAVEDRLAADLRKRGVGARASHEVFAETPKEQEEARLAILEQGYEAVLRVNLENIDRSVVTMDQNDDSEWSVQNVDVNVNTTLWDPSNDEVLWSAATRTRNPQTGADLGQAISAVLLPALARSRFILPVRER